MYCVRMFDNLDTPQHNQPNHADLRTLLESPPPILELEDVTSICETSSMSLKKSILFFRWGDAPEIG